MEMRRLNLTARGKKGYVISKAGRRQEEKREGGREGDETEGGRRREEGVRYGSEGGE